MIGNGPFNAFRKPKVVYIVTDSFFDKGVIKQGLKLETEANFSVQNIKDGQQVESIAGGRRLSDWRRLYSDVRLPLVGDEIFLGGDLTTDTADLSTADGQLIRVGSFIGEKDGMGNPAIVVIDGYEYEIMHREPWQNGIIEHYKYFAVRKSYG